MNLKHRARPKLPEWISLLTFWLRFNLFCLGLGAVSAQPNLHHLIDSQTAEQASKVSEGWLLVNELGCFQCHSKPPKRLTGLPAFDAPVLTEVNTRLTPEFVNQFIQNPDQSHQGTRMPAVMEHLTKGQKSEAARHLTAFLMHIGFEQTREDTLLAAPEQVNVDDGRRLFSAIGCNVCHPFPESGDKEIPDSLKHVRSKYQFKGLQNFLLEPQNIRKGFRMPDFNLTEKESKKLATFLMSSKPTAQPTFISTGIIEKGALLFSELLCIQCHTSSKKEEIKKAIVPFPSSDSLNEGCLAEIPHKRLPNYGLNQIQIDLIRSALSQANRSEESIYQADMHLYMKILRCNACHERQPLTPPRSDMHAHFTSSGEDLGDEGRIPPALNGVGRKLTRGALKKTIQGAMPVRPYMNTRMPNWGDTHADILTEHFIESDLETDEKPTPRKGRENQVGRNMWGRALMGIDGLGCIQCHPLNGNRSLGIQAMDLKHSSGRLRAPWFRDYLMDPAKFRPGTRMPSFWPNGNPSLQGLGGSTERQIDSIWAYLNELGQSRLPEGMETKGDFVLKPERRPMVFRTFMKDAGLHAIAVGFFQNFHVAFDSKSCRWMLAWSGPFLDAEATWDDRFTPLTSPSGDQLPWFPQSNPFWKQEDTGRQGANLNINAVFSGYRLDEQGIPSFHYTLGGGVVEDQIEPLHNGIQRTVKVSVDSGINKWLIYESERMAKVDRLLFQSDQNFLIRIEKGIPLIVEEDHRKQLWIQLSPASEMGFKYTVRKHTP